MTKPYLKWVGSKSRLFREIAPFFPQYYKDYYEPFAGSAATFLNTIVEAETFQEQGSYYLRDVNEHLMNCHIVVAQNIKQLIKELRYYDQEEQKNPDLYNQERQKTVTLSNFGKNVTAAARFIYLNRRAYGGMWRENKSGMFNVPKCDSQTFSLVADDFVNRLIHCSSLLKRANISCGEYDQINPTKEDFVFLDPPYYPISESASFTSYTRNPWTEKEHKKLFDYLGFLNNSGIKFVMTNSNSPYVRNRCSGYHTHSYDVRRFIDALKYRDGSVKEQGRESVAELIIWNYKL